MPLPNNQYLQLRLHLATNSQVSQISSNYGFLSIIFNFIVINTIFLSDYGPNRNQKYSDLLYRLKHSLLYESPSSQASSLNNQVVVSLSLSLESIGKVLYPVSGTFGTEDLLIS